MMLKLFQQANRADGIVVSILASQIPLEPARDPGSNPGRRTSFSSFFLFHNPNVLLVESVKLKRSFCFVDVYGSFTLRRPFSWSMLLAFFLLVMVQLLQKTALLRGRNVFVCHVLKTGAAVFARGHTITDPAFCQTSSTLGSDDNNHPGKSRTSSPEQMDRSCGISILGTRVAQSSRASFTNVDGSSQKSHYARYLKEEADDPRQILPCQLSLPSMQVSSHRLASDIGVRRLPILLMPNRPWYKAPYNVV